MNQVIAELSTLQGIAGVKNIIDDALTHDGVAILPPQDVKQTLALACLLDYHFDTVMLDPWYNKGFGGVQDNYLLFFLDIIRQSGNVSKHVYFWGFPEIVAPFVERIPKPLELVCWLTWYYKNNPSVIRGWRSSQNACLHLAKPGAAMYPERFLNEKQRALKEKGKLRYMPGPTSVLEHSPADVIEQPLLVGFVGRDEQTGHPSQKPLKVYDQLLQMTVSEGGLILDPMCGSGTTGVVAKERGFRAILCDASEEYTKLVEKRIGIERLDIAAEITRLLKVITTHEATNPCPQPAA
ncbi:site-specific DNA-methyltransferase [Chloracidobacterium aggregatum]|uniref:site-specific DNA-methyltransferase (adenine-specific) n=1 Tax=Chloracidobacterium sp. N TaxID=2821540 RepID=A0ABX8AZT2_9BACT|nr:site-specific DNA-methyltransferase [Chloracidobacterium aggregatum]QUV85497.1 site-specific DNA-methyltransferase [Chloracidobacterium sp. 2]QUV88099.1 site-specific DNA-methyltransferase [Chloracidobacterium sp. S]QUV91022.1 site-specific DNA-methyltransferase [Chloracidobacterium sp. A]QUV94209.1 site-specific DNA-methyltransferase [Chloracidobacterium sp. N]QUV97408.1 site-specific DNA-methyltransferase [Chloracidobacterium sp. E]